MLIEKLLKNTKFKQDAADIARQLAKRGIDRLELLADAPGRLNSVRIWGHPLSEVIDAIREAADKPLAVPPGEKAEGSAPAKSIETTKDKTPEGDKPLNETPTSEPGKPVGGQTK